MKHWSITSHPRQKNNESNRLKRKNRLKKKAKTVPSAGKEEIKQKRPHLAKKKVFLQDNAPAHKSVIAIAKTNDLKFELLPHAPYSPDLSL
ncbi:hypothetical protein TNCV_2622411 [Trichonephila clavipes]|uniref:Uncharacterized protein n=1 Tax=Trichonephila clavipes TaxID=2585209 RepID=A0A8X7BIX2_TRICX|nr:hypothetical protein TNCV_2622411 [Trichonephila clavipes]